MANNHNAAQRTEQGCVMPVFMLQSPLISEFNIAKIASCLRHLQADGYVRLISGTKWQWTGKTYTPPQSSQSSSVGSSLEVEPKNLIQKKEIKVNIPKNTRWDEFRRLCLYYAECIRLEDKAKVHAYSEHEGRSFISPSGYLNIRNLSLGGTLRIEIKENWELFLQTLHRRKSNPRFYIGYPTYVHIFKDSATGKNLQIITPIFVQQVECSVVHDALEIRATGSVEVNNDWLERRFKSSVLSASLHDVNFRRCYPIRCQQPCLMRTTYEAPIEIEFTGTACPWT